MNLTDKVAVVTGGASGLGEATVRMYVEKGARVAIFDMNEESGANLVSELGEDRVAFYSVNVTDENSVQAAMDSVVERFGAVHICNNFAGIAPAAKTVGREGAHPLDLFSKVISVNLIGTFNVARLAAEKMSKNEPYNEGGARGVIINTASVAAFEGQLGQAAYSASKGGVVGMALPMARDLAQFGIRVNTIAPGLIHTPLFDSFPEHVYKALESSVVNPQRLGRPEEVAQVSVSIVENEYINGECIRVDGAIRMQPR